MHNNFIYIETNVNNYADNSVDIGRMISNM